MKKTNTKMPVILLGVVAMAGVAVYLYSTTEQMLLSHQSEMLSEESASHDGHHMSDESTAHSDDHMHHMEMLVSSERAFIEGMVPHHQEAIDTAQEVLERGGTTADIRALAEDIIDAQAQEIAEMKQWYEEWYDEPYQDTGEYTPMMRDLAELSGVELDQTFLEDMIQHHMGAIMMARSVQPYVEHDVMAELTDAVIEAQSAEIQAMEQMLSEL